MSFATKLYMVVAIALRAEPTVHVKNAAKYLRERYRMVPAAKLKARLVALDDYESAVVALAKSPNNRDVEAAFLAQRRRLIHHLSRTGL